MGLNDQNVQVIARAKYDDGSHEVTYRISDWGYNWSYKAGYNPHNHGY